MSEQAYVLYEGSQYPLRALHVDENLEAGIHATLETIVPEGVNAADWLGNLARVQFQVEDSTRMFPLTITQAEIFAESVEGLSLRLKLASQLEMLHYSSGARAFQKTNVESAIQALLSQNEFDEFQRQWRYYKDDSVLTNRLQYFNESDKVFFYRLLAEHGITVQSVIDDAGEERFVFAMNNEFTPCDNATPQDKFFMQGEASHYYPTAFSIATLSPDDAKIFSSELENNSAEFPTLPNNMLRGHTLKYKVNTDTLTQKQNEHAVAQSSLQVHSTEPSLRAGGRFTTDDGAYLITHVTHEFKASTKHKSARYTNQVSAIASSQTFIPHRPLPLKTHAVTVQLDGDDIIPTLSEHKIKVRAHAANEEVLSTLTQLQSFVGTDNSGWHQPLLGSSALVLNTAFHEPDSVYALGSFATGDRPSVVDNQNNIGSHAFVSHSGHRMEFNGLSDLQVTNINTNDNAQSLQYKIIPSETTLNLSSQNSSVLKTVQGNMSVSSGSGLKEFSNTQQLNVTGDYSMETSQGDIHTQVADLHSDIVTGTHRTQAGKNVTVNITQALNLKSTGNITFHSVQGDMQLSLQNGQLQLQTPSQLIISGDGNGDIHLSNTHAGVMLSSGGDVTLYGNTFATNASSQLSLKGHVNYDDKGAMPPAPAPAKTPTIAPVKDLLACDNNHPTPIAALGNCDYYQSRYNDFMTRHQACQQHVAAPTYYLEYGLKYCKKFSTQLYPKLSPAGQAWLPKARQLLQKYMEQGLAKASGNMSVKYLDPTNPTANELNNTEFTDFAFNTHFNAYWDAGYSSITKGDFLHIMDTIDFSDSVLNIDAWENFKKLEEFEFLRVLSDNDQKSLLFSIIIVMVGKGA